VISCLICCTPAPIRGPSLSSSTPTPSQIPSATRLHKPRLAVPQVLQDSGEFTGEPRPPLPLLFALKFSLPRCAPPWHILPLLRVPDQAEQPCRDLTVCSSVSDERLR
jgi:hypothetical protein